MLSFRRVLSSVPLLATGFVVLASGCGGSQGSPSGARDGGGAFSSAGHTCATRSGMRGKTTRTITAGGESRSYVAYLPPSLDPARPAPLVYVFHGAGMNGQNMYDVTGFSAVADREGLVVVFPDGQGASSATSATGFSPWNVSDNGAAVCGYGSFVNNAKAKVDFDLMDAIKGDVAQDQCLDTAHVFASGFSMGGYFSHHVGCDRTDVKSVAPGSGGTIASLAACATGHVPVIIFHGTSDPLIVPGCDDPNSAAQSGFPPSAQLWAQKNGCQSTSTKVTEDGDGGGAGNCYLYDGCPADGQVELCMFTGMGHCWAGGVPGSMFGCPTYASATGLAMSFWKKYAW